MKKYTKNKDRNNEHGFTLIELLATIAVLSIVSVIVMYTAINVIDSSKNKSYQISVSNIEKDAGTYALENQSSLSWISSSTDISDDLEYVCIRVQNLIDRGYFDSDVLKSKISSTENVSLDDYIYLERDEDNKAITKNILLFGDRLELYSGLCGDNVVDGNISFKVVPSGWSKNKKVTITYNIYNIVEQISSYSFGYEFKDHEMSSKRFNDVEVIDEFTVYDNGDLIARIDNGDRNIAYASFPVSMIDNEVPEASIESTNDVASSQTVTLDVSDNVGVVAYYFGKSNPDESTVAWINIEQSVSKAITDIVDSSGTWYLGVKDVVGHVKVVSKDFYETVLSVSNAIVTPEKIITMSENSFTIPVAIADDYYTFNGWYTISDFSGQSVTTYKPTSDDTLYGKTTENKLVGGSVTISGNNTYGDTLTATVNDTVPKADTYEYQWYYNSGNSASDGTKITGATSNKYQIKGVTVGKYIYVVVTAKKSNYRSTTLDDITDTKINKRGITVTAGTKSKTYDGSALTDSSCTVSNLAYSHSVTCNMTSGSTITNVGSVDNTISSVSVWNDAKSTVINDYYDIANVSGRLTVNKKSVTIPTARTYCKTSLSYTGSSQTLTKAAATGYSFSGNSKTNAGSYTVTATLSSNNYIWSDNTTTNKTFSCSISKVTPSLTVTPTSLSLTVPTSGSVTYTYNGDGVVSCNSSNTNVATCTVDTTNKKVTVTPVGGGSTTITVSAASTTNYNGVSEEFSVTVTDSSCYMINTSSGVNCRSSRTTDASNKVTALPYGNYYLLTKSLTENGYTWYYYKTSNCYVVENYLKYYGATCPTSSSKPSSSGGSSSSASSGGAKSCLASCIGGWHGIDDGRACYCCPKNEDDPHNWFGEACYLNYFHD